MKTKELLEEAFDEAKYREAIKYLAELHVEWTYESMKEMDILDELTTEGKVANIIDMAITNAQEDVAEDLANAIHKVDVTGWLRTRRREELALKRQQGR